MDSPGGLWKSVCLGREKAVRGCCSESHARTWEGCAEWEKERSPGATFQDRSSSFRQFVLEEQLIHRRLRHSQAPGTLPPGELSVPIFAAGLPTGLGTGSRGSSESAGEEAVLKGPGSSCQASNGRTEEPSRKRLSSVWPRGGQEGSCVKAHSPLGGAGAPAVAFPRHCHLERNPQDKQCEPDCLIKVRRDGTPCSTTPVGLTRSGVDTGLPVGHFWFRKSPGGTPDSDILRVFGRQGLRFVWVCL